MKKKKNKKNITQTHTQTHMQKMFSFSDFFLLIGFVKENIYVCVFMHFSQKIKKKGKKVKKKKIKVDSEIFWV